MQIGAFAVSGLVPVARPPLAIAAIQGRGHRSPLVDQWVDDVAGVVTAVVDDGRGEKTVWIQEADDGDDATSAGVQVTVGWRLDPPVAVTVGDALRVSGRVRERSYPRELSVTQVEAFTVTVDRRGQELPQPVVLGRNGRPVPTGWVDDDGLTVFEPAVDAVDFFESLEGMRVQVDDAVVVGATSRGQMTTVLADRGAGSTPRSVRGGLVLAGDDLNPERIQVETRQLAERPALAVGDLLPGPTHGVLGYSYGVYKLLATAPLPIPERSALEPEVTALGRAADRLTVATYNVENLAASASAERFERAARVIAHHLGGPELVALEEIQDDNGPTDDATVSAAATLARLTAAVSAAGGPRYEWCQLDPVDDREGGQPGGNIRVVLLYDPTRVEVVRRDGSGDVTVAAGPGFVPSPGRLALTEPTPAALPEDDDGVRKPLAVELRVAGRTFFVVVVHLSSKIGDDREFGSRQPPRWVTEEGRSAQARFVGDLAARILDLDPAARLIVLGDFNEGDDRPPLELLTAGRLTNLVTSLPRAERYSHTFNGNGQQIDHILVSQALAAGAEVDVVHCNIDLPAVERASDHDPVVARLPLR